MQRDLPAVHPMEPRRKYVTVLVDQDGEETCQIVGSHNWQRIPPSSGYGRCRKQEDEEEEGGVQMDVCAEELAQPDIERHEPISLANRKTESYWDLTSATRIHSRCRQNESCQLMD
jgi:hypothetical protein